MNLDGFAGDSGLRVECPGNLPNVPDCDCAWLRRLLFRSQFHDPESNEPVSPIAREDFLPFLEGRAREMGRLIWATYGEGFTVARPPAVKDLFDLG